MEDMLAIRNEYRLQEWSQIIQAGQNSGLSKREFCQQNGLSERQYYYWLNKVRTAVVETNPLPLVRLEESATKSEEKIQIQFWGAELSLPANMETEARTPILRALQQLC